MKRLRTFIALDLGKTVRDKAVALQESLARTGSDVKWVEPENLHLTLLFLGEVDDRDVPAVCRAVTECCREQEPFRMSVETIGCFPNLRRPRTVWIGVGEGTQEVVTLHDALETTLLELGCYRREDRQFTPHVTLGRVKHDGGPLHELAALLTKKADWQAGEVSVREVLVMSSELMPQGPIYSILSRAKLGSA
jgi:2'-5' RNA ligase